MANFGFGFIEIGTVTPRPQPGNDQPRMFRLIPDKALINRMGFNNQGADVAANRLKHLSVEDRKGLLIGGNIGKNKLTPNEQAVDDYIYCFNALFDYVDYFVVNVSSPNTPGLRDLQEKEPLKHILNTLQNLNEKREKKKPILLKIAPDLTDSQLDDIVEIVQETGIAGVIATNTTISRAGLRSDANLVKEMGGVSGAPLTKRSTEVIRYLSNKSNRSFPIIGVGGIHSAADAIEKMDAGASLVQIYTGFIYEGPSLISDICKGIAQAGK
ncbi:Dihydroorotate dehydrogenase [compost metagenome]